MRRFLTNTQTKPNEINLAQSWGKQSYQIPPTDFDTYSLITDVGKLLTLFRKMPEKHLFIRVSGLGLNNEGCGMERIPFAELHNVHERLENDNESLHLQGINLEKYDDRFAAFKDQITSYLIQKNQLAVSVYLCPRRAQ